MTFDPIDDLPSMITTNSRENNTMYQENDS